MDMKQNVTLSNDNNLIFYMRENYEIIAFKLAVRTDELNDILFNNIVLNCLNTFNVISEFVSQKV